MKKFMMILSLILLTTFAAACSSSSTSKEESGGEDKKEEKAKVADISIDNVEYTLPSEYDNASDDQLALKIDISVTNNGEDPLDVDNNNFVLYQGDTMAGESEPEDYNSVLKYATLSKGKKLEGSLYFLVDKGEDYQLVYSSTEQYEKEQEVIEFDIDGKDEKLLETAEDLQNPAKALSAYIDVLFYNGESPEFETLVGEDKDALVREFDDAIIEGFMSTAYISEDQIDKQSLFNLVKSMKAALKEKVKAQTVTKTISEDTAIVELTASPLDVPSMQPSLQKKAEDYVSKNQQATEMELQKFVFDEMAKEFATMKPSTSEVTVELQLKKSGKDKWVLDASDYRSQDISLPFLKFD
ncbi:hypothetical protein CHH83_18205 [Bacillus sp. 7586-K]|nr:hypothetical protein CHH83_18205 [Bacillus sp. 7586-K]